jgi:hypothetical protein
MIHFLGECTLHAVALQKKRMRQFGLAVCVLLFNCSLLQAQHEPVKNYRNFPIILTVQFHSLSLPFKNFGSNFSNVGFGVGTEVSFNGKQDWVQQFQVGWIHNKNVGNRLLMHTQTTWRPTLSGNVYGELKAGVGYAIAYRPMESFGQENGKWVSVSHSGKGMLMIPVGASIGYNNYNEDVYVSPFISYQLFALKGYNKSIPFVPEQMLQIGSRIHVKY